MINGNNICVLNKSANETHGEIIRILIMIYIILNI